MQSRPEISVVIPVFHAAPILKDLVSSVTSVLQTNGKTFEIICVDDGSKDSSWNVLKEIRDQNPLLRAFRLGKNFGQHKATLCGVVQSRGEWIVTMDDDFEHRPEDILPLIEKAKVAGADVFYAIPVDRQKSLMRSLASRFYKWISKVENADAGKGSSFRVISSGVVHSLKEHDSHLFFLDEILLWYTDNIGTATIPFGKSRKEVSGYNYPRLVSLSKNVFMISTTMPLKFVKFLGFFISSLSFIAGIWYIIHKIFFPTTRGFTSLIISVLFSAGLILLCLGIIGEYIGNLLIMQNKKPGYSIREEL